VKLLDAQVNVPGPNRFANAKSAKLTLLGPIRDLPFFSDIEDSTLALPPFKGRALSILPKLDPMDKLPKPDLWLDERSSYLAPSLKVLRLNHKGCLILEPVAGTREPAVFRRVGYWTYSRTEKCVEFEGQNGLDGWDTKIVILI